VGNESGTIGFLGASSVSRLNLDLGSPAVVTFYIVVAGVYHALYPRKRLILFRYAAFHFMHPSRKGFSILAFVLQEGFIPSTLNNRHAFFGHFAIH